MGGGRRRQPDHQSDRCGEYGSRLDRRRSGGLDGTGDHAREGAGRSNEFPSTPDDADVAKPAANRGSLPEDGSLPDGFRRTGDASHSACCLQRNLRRHRRPGTVSAALETRLSLGVK